VAAPLLAELPFSEKRGGGGSLGVANEVWVESRKLGEIVGPAVFMNLVFTMNVVSRSFAGHLGDLELAAFSMANTVVDGFNFAMLVHTCIHTNTMSIFSSVSVGEYKKEHISYIQSGIVIELHPRMYVSTRLQFVLFFIVA
jgi:hypothetical protein